MSEAVTKGVLPKRSKLTKRYYVNGQVECDYDLLRPYSKEFTGMIFGVKNEFKLRMDKK